MFFMSCMKFWTCHWTYFTARSSISSSLATFFASSVVASSPHTISELLEKWIMMDCFFVITVGVLGSLMFEVIPTRTGLMVNKD